MIPNLSIYNLLLNFWKTHLAAQLFLTEIIKIIILKHIRMISERSCDAEDWSKDAENSALPYIKRKTLYYNNIIIYVFIIIFYQLMQNW